MAIVNPHGPGEVREIEPYRVFFPMGLFLGLLGVGIWGVRFVPKQIFLRKDVQDEERYRADAREKESK